MFLHAKHAADKGNDSIVIKSFDTDVEVLACYFQNCISSNIIIRTGTSCKCRLSNVQSMCENFGEKVCREPPRFHTFADCDSVSALSGKGKTKHSAFDTFCSEGLSRLGETCEENDLISINWLDQPPELDSVSILISCSCKTGCANIRCSCVRQGLSYTDDCKCSNTCSNKDFKIVDIANDDDDDDGDDDDEYSVNAGDETGDDSMD
ncbi:unnamed protein product [Mytilus coruscus]|uniref:Tesmin/TSO1-like CXC domain-containing protein n=1 Tax=Mytilus coruscus TaxID=42192 RepID=A0A6J8B5S4_MYTCO|nr:unnamed protein product [Mytilus coruscus]